MTLFAQLINRVLTAFVLISAKRVTLAVAPRSALLRTMRSSVPVLKVTHPPRVSVFLLIHCLAILIKTVKEEKHVLTTPAKTFVRKLHVEIKLLAQLY